jgi:mannose-6-phosphate isomerase-like protein (cupin superfamily)
MDGFMIDRADGRADGEDWTEDYEELPGRCQHLDHLGVDDDGRPGATAAPTSLPETFIIRRGWATFTIGAEELQGHAGQVLVVPADTPHKFATGPDGYEGIHIHANYRFVTEWLE